MTTIFAPITSPNNSAISVVRISGKKSLFCLEKLGVKNLQDRHVKFAKIIDPRNNETLDEALITYFQAPKSFTGEDVVEIAIHSSKYIAKNLLQILSEIEDVKIAQAGEFSKRAFLNNKIDLTAAEGIVDLIKSETAAQHKQALKQLSGAFAGFLDDLRMQIIKIQALIEGFIDFAEDEVPENIIFEAKNQIEQLKSQISLHLNDEKRGQKIKDGLSLAIIGEPNVGKSSLLNFLTKSEAAIVSDIAGTTRDVIEISLDIAGYAVKIADTAGIRQSSEKIEQEGIKRAISKANEADLVILVLDASNPIIKPEFEAFLDKAIIIVNKADLSDFEPEIKHIKVSLKKQKNTDKIFEVLENEVKKIMVDASSSLITQERHRICLQNAFLALQNFDLDKNIELAAEDLRIASQEIATISGKVSVDDILDVLFSKFCVGK
jgi:tRNA modification GTPase